MGLLDGIVGEVLGKLVTGASGGTSTGGQTQPSLLILALQLIQKAGGLQAILDRLKQAGLTKQANSWVSTGTNEPVSGDQIKQALGPDMINQLSAGTGMDTDQVGNAMAQVLPDLVNQLTPEGQVPENHQELVNEGLTALFPASLPDR